MVLTHWKSTITGGLIAGLIAISTIDNIGSLSKFQVACCFAAAALTAMFGAVSADAKQSPPSPLAPQPPTPCPTCGK